MHQKRQELKSLQRWLDERGDAERATLARLWRLQEGDGQAPGLLAEAMLRPDVVERLVASLAPPERDALARVQEHGGSVMAPVLEREFGTIRRHADYPNPRAYLLALEQPPSPTERLYTLALIQPVQEGTRRTYAIPPELLALLPPVPPHDEQLHLGDDGEPERAVAGDARFTERWLLMILALAQDDQLEVIPTGGLNKASLVRLAKYRDKKADLTGVYREEHCGPSSSSSAGWPRGPGCYAPAPTPSCARPARRWSGCSSRQWSGRASCSTAGSRPSGMS